jgi:ankyrin repeat protein
VTNPLSIQNTVPRVLDFSKRFLLDEACRHHDESLLRALIAKGADLNAADGSENGGCVFVAACNTNDAILATLLDFDASHAHRVNKYGGTPLIAAASNANAKVVELLLAVSTPTEAQFSAACLAASSNRNSAVLKLLIAAGGDVLQRGAGSSCCIEAASNENAEVMAILLKQPGCDVPSAALQTAAQNPNVDVCKMLIEAGAGLMRLPLSPPSLGGDTSAPATWPCWFFLRRTWLDRVRVWRRRLTSYPTKKRFCSWLRAPRFCETT